MANPRRLLMKERIIPMSDHKLWVIIEGIDMEHEAWELIRLFFVDAQAIHFVHHGEQIQDITPGALLLVKVEESKTQWSCSTYYFPDISTPEELIKAQSLEIGYQSFSKKQVSQEELERPGGSLLRSRKILVGLCIYEVLSKISGKHLPYGSLTGVRPVKLAMQCLNDGLDKPGTIKQLTKATGMTEQKAALLFDVAKVEQPYSFFDKKRIHLYVGIPFCASRCLYCSFTAYPILRYEALVPKYLAALEKEIKFVARWVQRNRYEIDSVYMGGGTPTALDSVSLFQVLAQLHDHFDLKGKEFTVEAGRPDTITQAKLEAMRDQQVTRISINPQTMNGETLKLIGRNHTPKDIQDKYQMARNLGFDNINMDLIAGLPKENLAMFSHTLDLIEAMAPDSLTVHTMAVKRASRLREEQDDFSSTSDEAVEAMIEEAREAAARMGMGPYYLYRQKNILANLENTGYAKPGFECLYNIHTMEEKQTVIALGAGSASKFVFPEKKSLERSYNVKEVTQYIDRIDEMLERKQKMFEVYELGRSLTH